MHSFLLEDDVPSTLRLALDQTSGSCAPAELRHKTIASLGSSILQGLKIDCPQRRKLPQSLPPAFGSLVGPGVANILGHVGASLGMFSKACVQGEMTVIPFSGWEPC